MSRISRKNYSELIHSRLQSLYPDAKCHLEFENPFQLIVSTVLSAQCTDTRVNAVMVPLYKSKYFGPGDIIKDGEDNFRENVRSINFYINKSKAVISLCRMIIENYNGKVPDKMEELVKLPGVGRKSASVILGHCFGKKDVIIADTHLKRVTNRLGLSKNSDPEKIEIDLKKILDPDIQYNYSMTAGEHGRTICFAKKPKCEDCTLNDICPYYKLTID